MNEYPEPSQPEHWQPEQHPPELSLPDLPATGHPDVDAALRGLAEATGAAPSAQLPAYQAAHSTLRDTLASIDAEG